jgi:hypothetical protein
MNIKGMEALKASGLYLSVQKCNIHNSLHTLKEQPKDTPLHAQSVPEKD